MIHSRPAGIEQKTAGRSDRHGRPPSTDYGTNVGLPGLWGIIQRAKAGMVPPGPDQAFLFKPLPAETAPAAEEICTLKGSGDESR